LQSSIFISIKEGKRTTKDPKNAMNIKRKCLLTVLQMLSDRNYEVEQKEETKKKDTTTKKDDFDEMLCRQIVLTAYHRANEKLRTAVVFPSEPKLGVALAREYIKVLEDDEITDCIVVTQDGVTTFALPHLNAMSVRFQVFTYLQLENNLTHHAMFPKHTEITDPAEKEAFYKKYKCDKKKYPIYNVRDFVCQYYDYKIGALIKIDRRWGGQIIPFVRIVSEI
jgi:DNA-directed RNA polymerase subunit H (RpoH/RPB5)